MLAPARAGVARNASHLVLGQIGTTAMAIALSAALGRYLGASDFGLFFLATSTAAFASVLVEWGQPAYVVREVAREPARAGELLGTALGLRLLGGAIVTVATVAVLRALGYDARTLRFTAALMVATLPFFLAQAYAMVFRGRERMDREAMVSVLNKALTLAATFAALTLGLGLSGVVGALGLAGLVALVFASVLLRRMGGSAARATAGAARELVVGGTPLVAMSLAIAVQGSIDAVVLSKLAPADAVGWYGAARNVIGTLVAPAAIIGTAAYPRLSRAVLEPASLAGEFQSALRPLLALGALGAVGTWLFADVAISVVYGLGSFGPAVVILQVFAPGMLLLFIDMLLSTVILALGRSKALAAAKVLNVATCTALNMVLIPWCQARFGNGGIGVVLAFGASELIMFGASLWILPRGTVPRGSFADVARALAAGGGTLLLMLLVPRLPPLVAVPLAILVFGMLGGLLGLLRREDLELVRALLKRRTGA